jgi:hypothetical protein
MLTRTLGSTGPAASATASAPEPEATRLVSMDDP